MWTRLWFFWGIFSVLVVPHCCYRAEATIGVLFNEISWQSLLPLRNALKKQNLVDQALVRFSTEIQQVSATDSFNVTKTVCDLISKKNGVAALISVQGSETSPIQESICFNSELPFISLSWGPTQENNISMSLNFYPEARLFAKGLMEVVKALRWNSFVILYETEEGLIRMQEILKLQEFHRGKRNSILVKQLGPGPDYRMLLKEIRNASEYIILDCKTESIIPILLQAKDLRMLELHNNYFLTSLDAHTLDYTVLKTTANITTIRLFDPNRQEFQNVLKRWLLSDNENEDDNTIDLPPHTVLTETVLLYDAFTHVMECIKSLAATSSIETNPINCEEKSKSKNGFALYNFCRVKKPDKTLTGAVKFDEFGNRVHFKIDIVDADMSTTVLGSWHSQNESMILYRGEDETFDASVANLQKIKVIVSSRMGPPYLMARSPSYEGEVLVGNARYKGYSMDLISKIAEIIGFQFEFRLTEDGKYGNWDPSKKKWTGLIGDLLERKAHLAICDLTITHERREVADFSMPFMTLGISILHKKQDKKDINMFAFLDPFSVGVWIYTATLYLIMSIVLYFISRMTPGDWENPHPCEENPEELENIWDIKNCLWLTLGSIMTQGCDILPKGISSRMTVSMWWFFSLIMTSSYTANLAAFLTKANMEPTIDGAEALSKQTKVKYGLLESGSTESFFRNSNYSTYQRMWLNMQQFKPSVFERNNSDGVNRVNTTRNGLYAFLMESTQIEYVVATNCELKQVGSWLDTKSYGIAMPMNSPYRSAINKAILKLQESGELGELKKKWWLKERAPEKLCDSGNDDEDDGAELALANVGGVFLVLGIGISIAFILAILEFLWNVRNVSVEEHMSYWEALKVEFKFACNIWITKKKTKPASSVSSGSSGGKSNKTDNKSIMHSILHNHAGSFLNISNSKT